MNLWEGNSKIIGSLVLSSSLVVLFLNPLVLSSWLEMTDVQERDAWERARTMAAIIIQPHDKRKITPRRLLPLHWDKNKTIPRSEAPELTAEERRKRFEEVARRLGDEINL